MDGELQIQEERGTNRCADVKNRGKGSPPGRSPLRIKDLAGQARKPTYHDRAVPRLFPIPFPYPGNSRTPAFEHRDGRKTGRRREAAFSGIRYCAMTNTHIESQRIASISSH